MAAGRDASGALLTWLRSFDPPGPCAAPPDLASGESLGHALHRIDPSWFDESWLGRIRGDPEGGAPAKAEPLRQLLHSVLEYWQHVLGRALAERHVPDAARARRGDPEQLRRLAALVLGCAVCCERREEHIRRIMTLEEPVQREVMAAIQELLDPEPPEPMAAETYGSWDTQSRQYYFLSQEPPEEGSGQRCRELEQQLAALQEDKALLAAENRALRQRLQDGGAPKLQRLQAQVEELQEENCRLESGREELRARCARLEREARELAVLAGEARALRDELELLRPSAARAGRLEAAVAGLRGRAAAAGELRRRARALEERHAAQARRAAHLQAQLGRAQAGRAQLEAARRQVAELSGQQAEAALREQRWQLELRQLRERCEALSREKERLQEQRDTLREANEELRCAQELQRHLGRADAALEGGAAPARNLAAEILPAELRDTVTRAAAREPAAAAAAGAAPAQAGGRRGSGASDGAGQTPGGAGAAGGDPRGADLEVPRGRPPRTPPHPPGDPPGPAPLAPVLRLLRGQLQEKDALIRHLESDRERSWAQREREERLLVTAWYNMGLALQRCEAGAAAAAPHGGGALSFLARQRLATAARRARAPHGRAPPS